MAALKCTSGAPPGWIDPGTLVVRMRKPRCQTSTLHPALVSFYEMMRNEYAAIRPGWTLDLVGTNVPMGRVRQDWSFDWPASDNVPRWSLHQLMPSLAFDVEVRMPSGQASISREDYRLCGELAEKNGLVWGGANNGVSITHLEACGSMRIRLLQERLLALGFDSGPADGLYRYQTHASVFKIEQEVGATHRTRRLEWVHPLTWGFIHRATPDLASSMDNTSATATI